MNPLKHFINTKKHFGIGMDTKSDNERIITPPDHKHRWAQTPGQEVDKRYSKYRKPYSIPNKYTKAYCIRCGKNKVTQWGRDENFPYPENNKH